MSENYDNQFNGTLLKNMPIHNTFNKSVETLEIDTSGIPDQKQPITKSLFITDDKLKRTLSIYNMQMITTNTVIGVGLFVSSGRILSSCGPLGSLLGLLISGVVTYCFMISLTEMVSFIPISGSVTNYGSRFVDEAFGFALGLLYWLSYAMLAAQQLASGIELFAYYKCSMNYALWCLLFYCIILIINLLEVKLFARIISVFAIIKMVLFFCITIMLFVINRSPPSADISRRYSYPLGFLFWNSKKGENSPPDSLTMWNKYGTFRPRFGQNQYNYKGVIYGYGGEGGRLLSVLHSSVEWVLAYTGIDSISLTAGESLNPRESLPIASKRVVWKVMIYYFLSNLASGINVWAGDARIQTLSSSKNVISSYVIATTDACKYGYCVHGEFTGPRSPFVVAFKNAGLCILSAALNAIFIFFAVTAAASSLYSASRQLYSMALQGKCFSIFTRCFGRGIPYAAVLGSGMIVAVAFLSRIPNESFHLFITWLLRSSNFGFLWCWASVCFAYLRFYFGLQIRSDVIQRSSKNYPYKSLGQPYVAFFCLIFSLILVFLGGLPFFNIETPWWIDMLAAYFPGIFFCIAYMGYKIYKNTYIIHYLRMDFTTGRFETILAKEETYKENIITEVLLWIL